MVCWTEWRRRCAQVAKLPRREAGEPAEDVPSIVARLEGISNAGQRRHRRLRLRDQELVYRLLGKRLRRRERVADGAAKSIDGSLLTSSGALLLGGHFASWTIGLAVTGLLLFGLGTIFAVSVEYESAAWDSEADRIIAALDEVEKNNADG